MYCTFLAEKNIAFFPLLYIYFKGKVSLLFTSRFYLKHNIVSYNNIKSTLHYPLIFNILIKWSHATFSMFNMKQINDISKFVFVYFPHINYASYFSLWIIYSLFITFFSLFIIYNLTIRSPRHNDVMLSGSRWGGGGGARERKKKKKTSTIINALAVRGHELWPLTEENQNKYFIK